MSIISSVWNFSIKQCVVKIFIICVLEICFQKLHAVCAKKTRSIYIFDYSCVVAKNYCGHIFKKSFFFIGISSDQCLSLINYRIFSTWKVLISWDFSSPFCYIIKNICKFCHYTTSLNNAINATINAIKEIFTLKYSNVSVSLSLKDSCWHKKA